MTPPLALDESTSSHLPLQDLRDAWPVLTRDERQQGFLLLSRSAAETFFLTLGAREQASLVLGLPSTERRSWMRLMPPDDAADLVQVSPASEHADLLEQLDEPARREVQALLAYAEDAAGGLMNPRFVRVRPEMTVDEAICYIRKQASGWPPSTTSTTSTCSTPRSTCSGSCRFASCSSRPTAPGSTRSCSATSRA